MNNYRMKALRELDKAEEQVKQGVRMQLKERAVVRRRKVAPRFAGVFVSLATILLLVFLIRPDESGQIVSGSAEFSISEVLLKPLKLRESSFVAVDLQWGGEQAAILQSIELVNFHGVPLSYHEHHLEMRPWNTANVETGQYQLGEFPEMEEFSGLAFEANSNRPLLLELIGNEGFKQMNDLALRLSYTINGQELVQTLDWATLDMIIVEQLSFTEIAISLGVTEAEIAAYNAFKKTRDAKLLADLSPISIARLYFLADIEGDDALQYAFYTEREESIAWSYEQQLTFPAFDRLSLDEAVELFEAVSSGIFVHIDDNEGNIAFKMNGIELGFQLIKNDGGIWQVAFMPMQ